MAWNEMIEYAKLNTDTFIVKDAPCGTQIDLAILRLKIKKPS
jgi:hypothetical protein